MSPLPPIALSPPRDLAALLRVIDTGLLAQAGPTRDMASAIRCLTTWLGISLERLPTDPPALRRHLAKLNAPALGVSPQRLANVKSLVRRALELSGVRSPNQPVGKAVTPAWAALLEMLVDHTYIRSAVAPFARFCSRVGIEPDAVSDAAGQLYLAHLERVALVKKPRTTHQTLCRNWQRAAISIVGWPTGRLVVPRYFVQYTFQITDFPLPFQVELGEYLRRLECKDAVDVLSDDAPIRPLKPSSVKTKAYQIRQAASALVHSGMAIDQILSLSVLVAPDNYRAALRYMLDRPRQNRENTRTAGMIAHTLRTIAKYHVHRPADQLSRLDKITRKLNQKQLGMTDKNIGRLSQFKDPATLTRFLRFSLDELARLSKKGTASRSEAIEFQLLLVLEILIHAPMRINDLASLDINRAIRLPKRRDGDCTILIRRGQSKTRQPMQYQLPSQSAKFLIFYIDHVLPILERPRPALDLEPAIRWLFPGPSDRSKRPDTLSKQISRFVMDRLGIEFSPHLIRHLAATLHINERAGDYETPRRLLGHASHDTTYGAYQGLETDSATRLHGELIRSRRAYTSTLPVRSAPFPSEGADAQPKVSERKQRAKISLATLQARRAQGA